MFYSKTALCYIIFWSWSRISSGSTMWTKDLNCLNVKKKIFAKALIIYFYNFIVNMQKNKGLFKRRKLLERVLLQYGSMKGPTKCWKRRKHHFKRDEWVNFSPLVIFMWFLVVLPLPWGTPFISFSVFHSVDNVELNLRNVTFGYFWKACATNISVRAGGGVRQNYFLPFEFIPEFECGMLPVVRRSLTYNLSQKKFQPASSDSSP